MVHTVALHFTADIGGFVDTQLVRAIAPVPQCQDNSLRKFVPVFASLDDLHQLVGRGQHVDAIEQLCGEVPNVLCPSVMDGENQRSQAQLLQFKNLPGAKGLSERRETFEHVGEVEGGKRCGHLRSKGIAQGDLPA